jgi:hypothetical protein
LTIPKEEFFPWYTTCRSAAPFDVHRCTVRLGLIDYPFVLKLAVDVLSGQSHGQSMILILGPRVKLTLARQRHNSCIMQLKTTVPRKMSFKL